MKKKKPLLFAVATMFALIQASSAATISIENLRADNGTGTRLTNSGFTVANTTTTEAGVDVQNYAFSQTGDLDGLGADDTFTFDLIQRRYTGSTVSGTTVTLGTQAAANSNTQNWGANLVLDSDTITWEITNISFTSAESTVAFTSFDSIRKIDGSADMAFGVDYFLGLTGADTETVGLGTQDLDLTTNPDGAFLALTSVFDPAETGNTRIRNLSFSFETTMIPEPSSGLMIGVALATGLLSRRRSS